jgi:hypothetical protein
MAAAVAKPGVEKAGVEAEVQQVHRIRITLTSRNVKNLEKGERKAARAARFAAHAVPGASLGRRPACSRGPHSAGRRTRDPLCARMRRRGCWVDRTSGRQAGSSAHPAGACARLTAPPLTTQCART